MYNLIHLNSFERRQRKNFIIQIILYWHTEINVIKDNFFKQCRSKRNKKRYIALSNKQIDSRKIKSNGKTFYWLRRYYLNECLLFIMYVHFSFLSCRMSSAWGKRMSSAWGKRMSSAWGKRSDIDDDYSNQLLRELFYQAHLNKYDYPRYPIDTDGKSDFRRKQSCCYYYSFIFSYWTIFSTTHNCKQRRWISFAKFIINYIQHIILYKLITLFLPLLFLLFHILQNWCKKNRLICQKWKLSSSERDKKKSQISIFVLIELIRWNFYRKSSWLTRNIFYLFEMPIKFNKNI